MALRQGFDSAASEDIAEVTPLDARASAIEAPRLNLLLPGVSKRHLFGGAATALQLLEALGQGVELRVLVTDERQFEELDPARFSGWAVRGAADEDARGHCLVPLGDRHGLTVPVRRADVFIASAWWTAHLAQALAGWQAEAYAIASRPFVYLIQDFEPGFYPWSAKYVLAEQTYQAGGKRVAVFNSSELRRFFHGRGFRFEAEYAFDPVFDPLLSRHLEQRKPVNRQRQILVYGRPSIPRNAFPLIVRALRLWAENDPRAPGWRALSVGEAHPPVSLPNGVALDPLGKLDLDAYARVLSESAIGLSLMVSPHPSYPPLEMAAFGLRTLTNNFEAKRLGDAHPNIIGLDDLSADSIAQQLAALTAAFEDPDAQPWSLPPGDFARSAPPFPFAAELRGRWLADLDGTPPQA